MLLGLWKAGPHKTFTDIYEEREVLQSAVQLQPREQSSTAPHWHSLSAKPQEPCSQLQHRPVSGEEEAE